MRGITRFLIYNFLLIASAIVSCREPTTNQSTSSKTSDKATGNTSLLKYKDHFDIALSKTNYLKGVWRAEQKDLINYVKRKYLTKYKATPDQTSKKMIERQLLNTHLYFNASDDHKCLLVFFAYNGLPSINFCKYQKTNKNKEESSYKAKLFGKNKKPMTIFLKVKTKNNVSILFYKENNTIIKFNRENRSPEEILTEYQKKLNYAGLSVE